MNSKCSSRMSFIHNMLNNHQPKTLPVINMLKSILKYFSDFTSNSSCQHYLAHLLLNKFLLGFTTQIKISLNQWLTFLCMEPFEKSDKSQKYVTTHKKKCISRPQVKNSCRKPTYMLPLYFLVLVTHQNNIDSM